MHLLEDMEFLRRSSGICLILAAAFLILAVVFFFAMDIRRAFLIETGLAEHMDPQKMNIQKKETGGRKPPEKRIEREPLKNEFKVTRKVIVVHTSEPAVETIEIAAGGVCGHQPMETGRI